MKKNITVKIILLFIFVTITLCTTFAQKKIEFIKLDNKDLPISKLDDKSLLEFIDTVMLHSFDNNSIKYLISQQNKVKSYPLSFIYGIDFFSHFPFDEESYNKYSKKNDINPLDFLEIRGKYFKQYYFEIRNTLDTNILKQIKVNLNFEDQTELDQVFYEKRLKGPLAPFLKNNFKFFNSFASINALSRIEINFRTYEKAHEDYLDSDHPLLNFIRSQIKNDIIWIKIHNNWRWVNFFN